MDDQRVDKDGAGVSAEKRNLAWLWFRSILIASACFFAAVGLLIGLHGDRVDQAPPGYVAPTSGGGLIGGLVVGATFGAFIGLVTSAICGAAIAAIRVVRNCFPIS